MARRKRKGRQPKAKAWPNWIPLSGPGFRGTDFYGRQAPTTNDLITQFEDMVYACVTLIADTVSSTPVKLYVKTDQGQQRPKCLTRPVGFKTLEDLRKRKTLGRTTTVEEVVEHPALELLCTCNTYHGWPYLAWMTQAYKDTAGDAYWLLKKDPFGLPVEVYILNPAYMEAERDDNGFIIGWKYGTATGQVCYGLDDVIHFKAPNLQDPYGLGYSPLRAAWNRVQISFKELGYLDATLSNMGRPDAVISPDEPISPFEAERLAKEYMHRFRGQGNGGIFIADGPLKITPLNFPPRDLAELQVYQCIKNSISNAYHVPPDVWELGNANRASADAILYALALHSIRPRMIQLVETLNERLTPLYDGRLFFEATEIVPEDRQFLLQERDMLLRNQVITRDEVRQLYGFDSEEWAKEPLLPPGAMPLSTVTPDETEAPESTPEPEPTPVDRSSQAGAVLALQQAVYAGQLPREAAIAQAQLIFGFSPEQAHVLFPEVAPVKLTPEDGQADQQPAEAEAQPDDQAKAMKRLKAGRPMKKRSPMHLAEALQAFFRKQAAQVVGKVKAMEAAETKAIPANWFDVEAWTAEMFDVMRPAVTLYWDHAAKQTVSRIGASLDLLKVVQPNLKDGIEKATMRFCRETNETTRLEIDQAVKQLRETLAEGLAAGDVQNELTKRVQGVFEQAEVGRSYRIAVTEASRAQHAAMEVTAQASGIVKGKRWILSSDACPLCLPLAGKVVPLGENFTQDGTGPYSDIAYPPRHPQCRCDMVEVIEGVND